MTLEAQEKTVIGWTEFVDLPEWGIRKLRAKVDTGARTSALHVEHIVELPRGFVGFDVILHRKKRSRRIRVKAKITRRSRVRSSSGHQSERLFVDTMLSIGPVVKRIEVSLVDRQMMIHRMLLGREALHGPFVIDVNHRMIHHKKTVKKKSKKKTQKKVRRA
jgi:hypothetical protein